MARLTASNGVVVSVSDDKAERLRELGYQPVKEPKSSTKKRSASNESDEK